jgi:murein DD-endopeptidase MepM/ murein hydrolase activator NlpD
MKPSGRYTILVANRSTGSVHRATVPVRPIAIAVCLVLAAPILIGMGAAWKSHSNGADLRARQATLALENENYRQTTDALASQIGELQLAIADLGDRSDLDPNLSKAMDRLPTIVKASAMGGAAPIASTATGGSQSGRGYAGTLQALASPDDTFGLLRVLLEGLNSRLTAVSHAVERRNALADATPSMWPVIGWLSSTMGMRKDPITGGNEYHSGLDIASERGDPVFATAAGTVTHVGRRGAYGNLVVIDHGFGLESRYGHLLKYLVTPGSTVSRGDIIAQVGATGRATGYHLHYEVVANDRPINPLTLLTQEPLAR